MATTDMKEAFAKGIETVLSTIWEEAPAKAKEDQKATIHFRSFCDKMKDFGTQSDVFVALDTFAHAHNLELTNLQWRGPFLYGDVDTQQINGYTLGNRAWPR